MTTPDQDLLLAGFERALENARLLQVQMDAQTAVAAIDRSVSDQVHQRAAQAAVDYRAARFEEAGHSCVASKLGVPIAAVHVGRDFARREHGHVLLADHANLTPAAIQSRIIVAMAGAAARSLFGCDSYASSGDAAEANRLALLLGFDDRERLTYLDFCSARAQRLVRENAAWIEAVAETLKDRPDLTSDDIRALRPPPIPEDPTTC